MIDLSQLGSLGIESNEIGIVVVDHGSRRSESNQLLAEVVREFRDVIGLPIVEAAHMELAEPSIATAFARCVQQGARLIVGHPYFLAPGRHWRQDIPDLFRAAAVEHPGVRYLVTAPLGPHPLMLQIMADRVNQCLLHANDAGPNCKICEDDDGGCQLLP